MSFYGPIFVYLMMGVILGAGVLQAVHGHFWLLIAAVLVYLIALTKLGCLPSNKSH